jgi:hypothetical protein
VKAVAPYTGGSPMGGGKFVRRSLAAVSGDLGRLGHAACPTTVARLLRELDYAPRVNVKRFTGPPHPGRDRQFLYIRRQCGRFLAEGSPVLSIDAKKKELVGNFRNAGRKWCREAAEVNCHDFRGDAACRAVPYGLYDVGANRGYVCVGVSCDTPAFAADAVGVWWSRFGCRRYAGAAELLLLADAGGSSGCRPRLWKKRLAERVADRYGLAVTVCHYPTGASKWNPVEHRLFGPISNNWAGEPLRSLEAVLGFIRGTTNDGGLVVEAWLNEAAYPNGVKVSPAEAAAINIRHRTSRPQWNYTISPAKAPRP